MAQTFTPSQRSAIIRCMKTCTIEGCTAKHVANGLCRKHYSRVARHGAVDSGFVRVSRTGLCTVEGCSKPRIARGLCEGHYKKHRQTLSHKQSIRAVWSGMLGRCYDPNCLTFKYYGALGITVCDRWHNLDNFAEDVPLRPSKFQLGRIDHLRGYEPGNVKWITQLDNVRDRKNTRKVIFHCREITLGEACELADVPYMRIWKRLNRGLTFYQAIQ